MTLAPPRPLLLEANFARVWWAGLISWIGNGALFIALPVQVYGETGSTLVTALVVMAGALPTVLVGQFAGVLVDRLDYRRVLVWTNLGMAAVTLGFLAVTHASWWLVALVSFVASSVGQFLGPAENALLPTLVGRERLGEANSLNALNNNLARLIGPALGGLILAQLGFAAVILLDVLTFLVAALLLAGVVSAPPVRKPVTRRVAFLREWREGVAVVAKDPTLRALFVIVAVVAFGEGFISTLMAPFVRDILGGNGQTLGFIMSVQAVGGIIGAWLVARVADHHPALRLLALGAWGSGLLLLLYFNYALVYREVWPAVVITAVAGVPFAVFGTAQNLGLQRAAPQETIGRVFSACSGLMGLTMLIGIGVSGVLGERVGVLVINVDAATYLLAGLIAWWVVRRASTQKDSEVVGREKTT
ncbi:MFS transporter [Deinococcus planocerae]|uniref:MFS transporter n=1 Tax=Deinococcus planocerae TaxID=1737569 RepID=UPI000C7F60A1|nr:MFS transporter [Deinococcus planocerae]